MLNRVSYEAELSLWLMNLTLQRSCHLRSGRREGTNQQIKSSIIFSRNFLKNKKLKIP